VLPAAALQGMTNDYPTLAWLSSVRRLRAIDKVVDFPYATKGTVCGSDSEPLPLQTIHTMADKAKYGVIKDFVGHGVGWEFHSLPIVQHCRNNEPGVLVEGQTFTIEPMLTEGTTRVKTWKDEWTVVTADGKLSAQFEHTILITKSGHEVLTAWPERRQL
jgi:methionine aminopeptidase